jgi:DNA recombination protein RmuC
MNEILFVVGDLPIRTLDALIGFGALALVLLLTIAIVIARTSRRGAELAMAQAIRADELEERLSEMLRAQSESTGRVDAMGQALAGRQAEMARAVNERLDSVTHRVGQSMEATTRNTMDSLRAQHFAQALFEFVGPDRLRHRQFRAAAAGSGDHDGNAEQ